MKQSIPSICLSLSCGHFSVTVLLSISTSWIALAVNGSGLLKREGNVVIALLDGALRL